TVPHRPMTHLLLVPVTKFVVRHQLATGRPFSEVDRLVLRAVVDANCPPMEELLNTFHLPRRMLLEVLITLFQEGWIGLNSQGLFLPTAEGRRALQDRSVPLSIRLSDIRRTYVVVEQITGLGAVVGARTRLDTMHLLRRDGLAESAHAISPSL